MRGVTTYRGKVLIHMSAKVYEGYARGKDYLIALDLLDLRLCHSICDAMRRGSSILASLDS